jgi:SAM-dependent methyltransferase
VVFEVVPEAALSAAQRAIRAHYGEVAAQAPAAALDFGQACHYAYSDEQRSALPSQACSASRGCGNPLARADLREGERVLDLGCGGGIDVLLAAPQVGAGGHIYGLDMTPRMLDLARDNATAAGVDNVSFISGLIENVPLPDAAVDVVTSNCVINLSDDKLAVLREAYRVLVSGGRFVVADMVLVRPELPAEQRARAASLVGCTNGVLTVEEYRELMEAAGFVEIAVEPYAALSWENVAAKATQRGREDELAALDPRLVHQALAAAYVFGRKS